MKGKGLSMEFLQALNEAAAKTGFVLSEVKEERCLDSEVRSQVCEAGTNYTGAVLVRLTPAAQPCSD